MAKHKRTYYVKRDYLFPREMEWNERSAYTNTCHTSDWFGAGDEMLNRRYQSLAEVSAAFDEIRATYKGKDAAGVGVVLMIGYD